MTFRSRVILPLIILGLSSGGVWAQGYLQNMSEADQAYSHEDYGKAANLYRATLQQIAESTFERERMLLEQADQREKTMLAATKPAPGTKAYCLSHLADARFANQNYSSAKEDYQQVLEVLKSAPMDYGLNQIAEQARKQIQICEQKLRH